MPTSVLQSHVKKEQKIGETKGEGRGRGENGRHAFRNELSKHEIDSWDVSSHDLMFPHPLPYLLQPVSKDLVII